MTAHRLSSDDTSIGRSMPAGTASCGSAASSPRNEDAAGPAARPLLDAPTEVRPALRPLPARAGNHARAGDMDAPTEIRPRPTALVVHGRAQRTPAATAAPIDGPTMVIGRSDTPTALIAAVRQPPPVFVDPSGRRRSRLRWLAYALGLLSVVYTGLVGISFAGLVEPHTVLPFVDEVKQPERRAPEPVAPVVEPEPSTVEPRAPTSTVAPTTVPATPRSVAPTRSPAATRPSPRNPAVPPASPKPTTSPAPTPTISAPVEEPPSPPNVEPAPADGQSVDD
ncbi:hypothetical protein ACFY2Q_15385 [Micromonospora sp. NPDC000316]|uniref:hypothetical protein n=1 Tax=Micromonospora sp. NPDC000316 TaxID=3364216 RepID=UPI0036A39E4B